MKAYEDFIRSHNLVNRLYNMSHFFNLDEDDEERMQIIKKFFKHNLGNAEYVELLAKYLDDKRLRCTKNIELYFNLKELIDDLNYLKQYLLFDNEE